MSQKDYSDNPYVKYVTQNHPLYDRYQKDWQLALNSYHGGTEYKNARYLRAYAVDFTQPSETINTYVTNDDGSVVSKHKAQVTFGQTSANTNENLDGSFYTEKLDNTPLYNYVKLIVSEYNSILFRNPPQRELPNIQEIEEFMEDVDGEGNSINEFMSLVDVMTTIFGVCHIGCYKPSGSEIPRWRIHTPLDVSNWTYTFDNDGNLKMKDIVIKLEETKDHCVYRYITPQYIDTIFVGEEDDYVPNVDSNSLEQLDDAVFRIRQDNEMGYIPVKTIYQSTKVYNGVGSTVITDVAQIQRSIYGDMAEVYSAIAYGAHPTLIVDDETDALNDGQVGAEPGSKVRVSKSLTGESNHVYEFKSPSLDAISEIVSLVDNKVQKLTQVAMLRSEDLIKSSRSGEQIEVYDDKLAGLIRRKATNLENMEHKLWKVWFDWLNINEPEVKISYSRQYNKKALEHEIGELEHLIAVYEKYKAMFGEDETPNEELRDRIRDRLLQLLASTSTDNGL